ncbi:MAG: hypothetical protein FWD23_16980, partial [Oscillospiraceae bacterium]|nr:hypothetical protein [Oscillospiraceae bacterium]
VIMSDCDMICNINYKNVIDYHIKSEADITAVYNEHHVDRESASHSILYNVSPSTGRIDGVMVNPQNIEGGYKISMSIWVMRKDYMLNMLANALASGKTHFGRDILLAEVDNIKIMGYAHKGYCAHINSISSYFRHNMEMLDSGKRNELFYSAGRNFYTKVRDSEPTVYGKNANAKNSLIADGCVVDGTVENSVIFRGVKISGNSSVRNCIIMQDGIIGEDCVLEWLIADKSVFITDGKRLTADKEYLMYITKNKRI